MSGPLTIPDGPLIEPDVSQEEIDRAQRNWEQMSPEDRANVKAATKSAEEILNQLFGQDLDEAVSGELRDKSGKWTKGAFSADELAANYRKMHGRDPSPAQKAKLLKDHPPNPDPWADVDPEVAAALQPLMKLGLEVLPPGSGSALTPKGAQDIAKVVGEAVKEYPLLTSKDSPLPMKTIMFATTKGYPKLQFHFPDGAAAAVTSNPHVPYTWMNFNDNKGASLDETPADPGWLSPGTITGGGYTGIAWHELGHAITFAAGVDEPSPDPWSNPGDTHVIDFLKDHDIAPQDAASISDYAATLPQEAIGEFSAMWNRPEFRTKMKPALRKKVQAMFEDMQHVHHYDKESPREKMGMQAIQRILDQKDDDDEYESEDYR